MYYLLDIEPSEAVTKYLDKVSKIQFKEHFYVFEFEAVSINELKQDLSDLGVDVSRLRNDKKVREDFARDVLNGALLDEAKYATFDDLPPDIQKNLRDMKSSVNWLIAFLVGVGLQTYKLRKIQNNISQFVS